MKGKLISAALIVFAIGSMVMALAAGQFPYLGIIALGFGIVSLATRFVTKVRGDHYTDYYFKAGSYTRLFLQKTDKGYRWE